MSKGKRKPKLRDLSVNALTSEEEESLTSAFAAASSPIAIAVLGAVFVEHELEVSLRRRFRTPDDAAWEDMVDERGPLSTFSRKIAIGHALHLYDAGFKDNLNIVRTVRNAFAHSKRLIEFDHPLVSNELKRIKIPNMQRRKYRQLRTREPQSAYIGLCFRLAIGLISKRTSTANRARTRRDKNIATTPFFRALAPALGLGVPSSDFSDPNFRRLAGLPPLPPPPAGQSAGPMTEPPEGWLGALFRRHPKIGDKTDN